MEKSKLLEVLKANSVEANGFNPANIKQLQECGLLPTPKRDNQYLNQCSIELTEPLCTLDYPLIFTATTKKSGSFEKTITACINSTAEFESVIAELGAPIINMITKHNIDLVPPEHHYNAETLLDKGHECIAEVYMENRHLTLPVDAQTTLSEITLQALFQYPGHAFIFYDCKYALDFLKQNKEYYTLPAQEHYIEETLLLSKCKGQKDTPLVTELKTELTEVKSELYS